jgi:hypothetical protein
MVVVDSPYSYLPKGPKKTNTVFALMTGGARAEVRTGESLKQSQVLALGTACLLRATEALICGALALAF